MAGIPEIQSFSSYITESSHRVENIAHIDLGMSKSHVEKLLGSDPTYESAVLDNKYLYCYYDYGKYTVTAYFENNVTLVCYIVVLKNPSCTISITLKGATDDIGGVVNLGGMSFSVIASLDEWYAPFRLSSSFNSAPFRFYNELYATATPFDYPKYYLAGLTYNGYGQDQFQNNLPYSLRSDPNIVSDPDIFFRQWARVNIENESSTDYYDVDDKTREEWFTSDDYQGQINDWLSLEDVAEFRDNTKPNYFGVMADVDLQLREYIINDPVGGTTG